MSEKKPQTLKELRPLTLEEIEKLLDHFAGLALRALLKPSDTLEDIEYRAHCAYLAAWQMIGAREKITFVED